MSVSTWVDRRLANLADHVIYRLEMKLDALPEQIATKIRADLREVLSAVDGRIDGVLERIDEVVPGADDLAAAIRAALKGWWPL